MIYSKRGLDNTEVASVVVGINETMTLVDSYTSYEYQHKEQQLGVYCV